jgi:hypothetical protein
MRLSLRLRNDTIASYPRKQLTTVSPPRMCESRILRKSFVQPAAAEIVERAPSRGYCTILWVHMAGRPPPPARRPPRARARTTTSPGSQQG